MGYYYYYYYYLGKGAFSQVLLCTEKSTGKEYAVKIMTKKLHDKMAMEVITTEIRVFKRLNHPNIVKMKDIFETKNQYLIVMDKITGGELFQQIVKRKHYSEQVSH